MNGNMDPMTLNTNANGMRADFSARRGQIAAEVAARQAAIAEKRAVLASSTIARQGALRVEAQQRVLGQANGLVTALNNAILRLETITNRLKERAHRLGETSYTLSLLYEADQSLAATKEAMVGIETNISFATTSNTPMEDFKEAREQFLQVRTLLTDVRNILKEALTSLKQQEMPQQANTNEGATVESSTNIEVTN